MRLAFDPALSPLYANLPRQGVGADWCTREALRRLPPLRKPPAVIDLGCGPGRQTIVLAQHFRTAIQAVDLNQAFLDQMREAAEAAGVAALVQPRRDDFTRLPDAPGSFDLVWSEGAASVNGFQASLEMWAPLLRARGVLAVSDCTWLGDASPAELKSYWDRAYPGMSDIAGNLERARAAGLAVFDHFALPRSAWWDEYYAPLSRKIAGLQKAAATTPVLAEQVSVLQEEISLFQRWGDRYGYVFYLMRLA
ncbi:malonyl-[acyl-carrier protein] O-methyltransferase [mine drainage metagenome]|uniref:Malonyl-[acyl-carrier protein] O-methyltransferase n=1 Tax=mine drainage metagenome TaxID=410659 RepID=A0A1J5SNK4_9ZZZZ